MTAKRGIFGAAVAFAIFGLIGNHAAAQKSGGILRQYIIDSPASMSIHEETTVVAERPMMGVFNNPVIHQAGLGDQLDVGRGRYAANL